MNQVVAAKKGNCIKYFLGNLAFMCLPNNIECIVINYTRSSGSVRGRISKKNRTTSRRAHQTQTKVEFTEKTNDLMRGVADVHHHQQGKSDERTLYKEKSNNGNYSMTSF